MGPRGPAHSRGQLFVYPSLVCLRPGSLRPMVFASTPVKASMRRVGQRLDLTTRGSLAFVLPGSSFGGQPFVPMQPRLPAFAFGGHAVLEARAPSTPTSMIKLGLWLVVSR